MAPRLTPRPPWLLATLCLLTLTGCFDVTQELWFEPDGTARVVVDLAVPKSVGTLAKLTGGKELTALIEEQRQQARAAVAQDPNVVDLTLRQHEEGAFLHLVQELKVKDATKLPELFRKIADSAASQQREAQGTWDFRIERNGGNYVFTQRFVPDKAFAGANGFDPAERAGEAIAKELMKSLLAKNFITLRVHGPGIVEANGTVNEKKDTVEWKVSLAELLDAPPEGREFRAVVDAGEPLWLWPVVIGVPLAVLGLAISAARRRRSFGG
ncbi:hypothetical protein HPC49_43915 [Pyxidicoccus fallax]|uniref:Lipoprotein n=1 Tax=Pyxidicoccus fallax TaxID=394095 RepID=A0A848LRX6_9BACT|nr:hypothetical protein [Pyxidicoccus fallax]NMO20685.1 hypothetical protein [Pyxidicoccus fallax]NPC85134.1 hypothetical protein [Pyxidicoccus fallax]